MVQKLFDVPLRQRLKDKHLASGQQRGIDLKGGIFRGGPDENDASLLHKGQKSILLGLVETMNLIHKNNGPPSGKAHLFRLHHHLADFLNAAGNGAEIDEFRLRLSGDDAGKGGFSHAGRPPENHGADAVLIDQAAQHLPLSDQMFLSHKFLQAFRPESACQGIRCGNAPFPPAGRAHVKQ